MTTTSAWCHVSSDDRAVLSEDNPTECYQDDEGLLYFTQASLLNSFNGRAERMASYGYELEPGDIGLVLSERMSRQILFQLGLAEHVLKVGGKATRVWKTTKGKWVRPEARIHITQAALGKRPNDLMGGQLESTNVDEIVSSPDGDFFVDIRSGRWVKWTKELAAKHKGKWNSPLAQRWRRVHKDALSELVGDDYKSWYQACVSGVYVDALELMLDGMLEDEAIFERVRQVRAVDRVGTRQLRRERELREQRAIEYDGVLAIEHGEAGG